MNRFMIEYQREYGLNLSEIDCLIKYQQAAEKERREYLAQFEEDNNNQDG